MHFAFRSFPSRVLFGEGKSRELPRLLTPYRKVMVIASDRMRPLTELVRKEFGSDRIAVFSRIVQHVPQNLVDEAVAVADEFRPDVLLALGGGSATGLAKAMALASGGSDAGKVWPIIAVPTTFSGSEQTDIWGITVSSERTSGGNKTSAGSITPDESMTPGGSNASSANPASTGKQTGRSAIVLPELVIYDPALIRDMPARLAVTSAMNAMAHLVEAVYAPDGNPLTRGQALQGIGFVRKGLSSLADTISAGTPDAAMDARSDATPGEMPGSPSATPEKQNGFNMAGETAENLLFGAFLAGKCMREVSMSLHHKVAHVLGGSFGLDHAVVHAVLLPHVLQYQWPHLEADIRRDLQQALGSDPAGELRALAERAGGPVDLRRSGFREPDIPEAAAAIQAQSNGKQAQNYGIQAQSNGKQTENYGKQAENYGKKTQNYGKKAQTYSNPAPLEPERLTRMLRNAWNGSRPTITPK